MNIKRLLKYCRQNIRLLDNYHIPQEVKIGRVSKFFEQVIQFEFAQINVIDHTYEKVFEVLCKDIIEQCRRFLDTSAPSRDLIHAKSLLFIILSIERYIFKETHKSWNFGAKISYIEKWKIKRIFRKKMHDAGIRDSRVRVVLTGSLARGHSDYKQLKGSDLPKPTDYDIPRIHTKITKSTFKPIDSELNIPDHLKPLMSDVDIMVMNKDIFDSCNSHYKHTPWSFRLGEKYPTGVGTSPVLARIHQSLITIKIGGIRGRWVNYILLRDEEGYEKYKHARKIEIEKLEKATGRQISSTDVLIMDETVR